jgi:hypothetical protein
MNLRFLALTSFLIALLCHWAVFTFFTVVFPIDPEGFKPKFFFLGPILKQSDIKEFSTNETAHGDYGLSKGNPAVNKGEPIPFETTDPDKNPFTIKAIRKPLIPQTVQSDEKTVLKSTFDAQLTEIPPEEPKAQSTEQKLGIQPYRPLRLRPPGNEASKN